MLKLSLKNILMENFSETLISDLSMVQLSMLLFHFPTLIYKIQELFKLLNIITKFSALFIQLIKRITKTKSLEIYGEDTLETITLEVILGNY